MCDIDKAGSPSRPKSPARRGDAILRVTRWLAIAIVPFLIIASAILYLWPNDTGRLFAWPTKPPMTAMMLGAAYMGGNYFFSRVITAQQWHTIRAGFVPVTALLAPRIVACVLARTPARP